MRHHLLYMLYIGLFLLLTVPVVAQSNQERVSCETGEMAIANHMERAGYYRGQREYDLALGHYNCVLATAQDADLAYGGRGLVYLAEGSYQLALSDFDVAIDLNPEDPRYHNNRGWTLRMLEEYEAALESLDRAISMDPNYGIAYNNRGIVHTALGNLSEAVRDYNIAIEVGHPIRHAPYMNLGDLYRREYNDPEEAVQWYEKAVRFSPSVAIIYKVIGDTYLEMNDVNNAETNYRIYVNLENDASNEITAFVQNAIAYEFIRRFIPSIIIALIVLAFIGNIVWRYLRDRRRQQQLAQMTTSERRLYQPVMLSSLAHAGQTAPPVSDGVPVQSARPAQTVPSSKGVTAPETNDTPASGDDRPGWQTLLLLPLMAGVAWVVGRLFGTSD